MVDIMMSKIFANKLSYEGIRECHFIGIFIFSYTQNLLLTYLVFVALRLYGKEWKKVENHIKTRSGAQIRSHAQKFF